MSRTLNVEPSEASKESKSGSIKSNYGIYCSIAISVICSILILFSEAPEEVVGLLVIALTVALLLSGVPIGIGMVAASLLGLWGLSGAQVATSTLQDLLYGSTANWSLSVIPLFIFMGIALWKSGITARAFDAARQWLGMMPGGLAIATNFSGAGLAAASGSSLGITYALGRIAIPEMLRAGYRPSLSTAVVAVAGTLGQLIPPSILLVVYASVAQTSIGPQLVAAIVPGIILATAYALMILIRATVTTGLAPRADLRDTTWRTRVRSLSGVMPILVVVVVVVGGMTSGFFTPTEAGAFGAFAALIVSVWGVLKQRSGTSAVWRVLRETFLETAIASAGIFVMLIGVYLLTRLLTVSRVTTTFTEWIVDLGLSPIAFLLILILVFLVLGMFLEPLAMILLTVPVLIGPLESMGIDMLWFGIFLVILCEVAQVSPPLGLLSFVVHKISQEPAVNLGNSISLIDVFKGVMWFVLVSVLVLFLLIAVPDLVTWLPSLA